MSNRYPVYSDGSQLYYDITRPITAYDLSYHYFALDHSELTELRTEIKELKEEYLDTLKKIMEKLDGADDKDAP